MVAVLAGRDEGSRHVVRAGFEDEAARGFNFADLAFGGNAQACRSAHSVGLFGGRLEQVHIEPDEAATSAALDRGAAEVARPIAQRLIDAVS